MVRDVKSKIKKAKNGILKIPIAIISLVFGAFFLIFLAIFVRKKGKKRGKKRKIKHIKL